MYLYFSLSIFNCDYKNGDIVKLEKRNRAWMSHFGRRNCIPLIYWYITKDAIEIEFTIENCTFFFFFFITLLDRSLERCLQNEVLSCQTNEVYSVVAPEGTAGRDQSWHKSRPCSALHKVGNLHFCFNLQGSILCLLVFFHFSERASKGHDTDAAKTTKFETCGCLWVLLQHGQSAELNSHLSSGTDLLGYLYSKHFTSLVFVQLNLFQLWLNIYSFYNIIFFWTEFKIWKYVKKYILCHHVSSFHSVLSWSQIIQFKVYARAINRHLLYG